MICLKLYPYILFEIILFHIHICIWNKYKFIYVYIYINVNKLYIYMYIYVYFHFSKWKVSIFEFNKIFSSRVLMVIKQLCFSWAVRNPSNKVMKIGGQFFQPDYQEFYNIQYMYTHTESHYFYFQTPCRSSSLLYKSK